MPIQRTRQPRIRHLQSLLLIVPNRVNERYELAINTPLAQRKIHRSQHLRRHRLNGSMGPQNAADQGRVNSCGSALAAHIADHWRGAGERIAEEVIYVATNRLAR